MQHNIAVLVCILAVAGMPAVNECTAQDSNREYYAGTTDDISSADSARSSSSVEYFDISDSDVQYELADGCCGGCDLPRSISGVKECGCCPEPTWSDAQLIPWEAFAQGEYIGPHRTPHVPYYRIRVDDIIEFVFQISHEQTTQAYRLMVGDTIQINSSIHPDINDFGEIRVLNDGSISVPLVGRVMAARKTIQELQDQLNQKYEEYFEKPSMVVSGINTNTKLVNLIDAVDARAGSGGQARLATVSPDGTVQLPMIGSMQVVGLTLDELNREVNMRYRQRVQGVEVTSILDTRAPRSVYVLGEVDTPGRYDLVGPTTAMQSLALAGGWNPGGRLKQIVVFRRDQNWKLMAIKIDLRGALHGWRPAPCDEIWLRDSDIVLVPKSPIQRAADAADLYFTRTIYAVFPINFFGGVFDSGSTILNP